MVGKCFKPSVILNRRSKYRRSSPISGYNEVSQNWFFPENFKLWLKMLPVRSAINVFIHKYRSLSGFSTISISVQYLVSLSIFPQCCNLFEFKPVQILTCFTRVFIIKKKGYKKYVYFRKLKKFVLFFQFEMRDFV